MPDNRINYLRGMLNQMETCRLDEMLRAELEREQPDGNAVRMLLSVLEERETDAEPETGPEVDAAWQKYIARTSCAPSRRVRKPLMKAASVGVVLAVLLTAMPQRAEAGNIWDRLIRWTSSVYELFSPDESRTGPDEYVFRTDNPGLQQVYDTLVAQGVTEPVVPMWIPEGYELVECKTEWMDKTIKIRSSFSDGESYFNFFVIIYEKNISKRFYKDNENTEIYEHNGETYNLIKNEDKWVVIWTKDNLECSIAVNCQEEVIYDILRSIYAMEEN